MISDLVCSYIGTTKIKSKHTHKCADIYDIKVYESRYIVYLATSGSKRETTN